MLDIKAIFTLQQKRVVGVVLAVVAIAGVLAIGFALYKNINRNGAVTTAPKGEVVQNFPQSLIPKQGVVVKQSYSVNYADGKVTQPVVEYYSPFPMWQNVAMFKEMLANEGWKIAQAPDVTQKTTFIYAVKQVTREQVNITLQSAPDNRGINITIAYLATTKP